MATRTCCWAAASACRRQLHTALQLLGNSGKPRIKSLPTSSSKPPRSRITAAALTPEVIRQRLIERDTEAAADPRLGRRPRTELFLRDLYDEPQYQLSEALRRHREFAAADMLNNPSGSVLANFVFSLRTAKQTKFVQPFSKMLRLPHQLPKSVCAEHSVLVFCTQPELAERMRQLGATDAGGTDLLDKLEAGIYHQESFDYVLCHPDFWPTLLKARKLLMDAMPQQKSEQITEELESALELYRFGQEAQLTHIDDLPDRANCSIVIGQLNWPDYHLEINLSSAAKCLLAERPKRVNNDFITGISVACPPSDERFLLDLRRVLVDDAGGAAAAADAADDGDLS